MTLFEIVDILKKIALTQPNIRSASDGSVYDKMNTNPSVQYDVFHISQTNHQEDFETDYYGLQLFYISRLEDSLEDNRLQIQSIGKEVLGNVIRTFCENFSIDYPTITYIPFTQKFNDLTAGVYCNVRLEVPKDLLCADDYVAEVVPGSGIKLQDISITIDRNGITVLTPAAEYDGIGEVRIVTDVPQAAGNFQDKEVEYTENGSYVVRPDPSYDALTSVSVDVLVPDNYDKGYEDGKEDGAEEQKAKMTSLSVTANGDYNRADGYSAVTVDVPSDYQDGYDDGFDDGEAAQKAKMIATAITENGEYGRPDGYSAVTVDVPDRYDEGFADGEQAQKDKMVTTSVTENGLYYREDGYSAFLVEVPQTGASNQDLIANLQGDYFIIPEGTTHLRDYAFYYACFSSITIPNSVTAIGRNAFFYNECLETITIPDSVTSIGVYAFSSCRNLTAATLGSGCTSLPNNMFGYADSLTGITIPETITSFGSSVFRECSALTHITFNSLIPPTLATISGSTASLGSTDYTFPIYVPCESVEAYKTAFGQYYAPRIQCRPEEMITALTLNVATAITDSGTATTTYSPSSGTTDIRYSCNNTAYATIDEYTGEITVVANGNVTICATDLISGLQDCKNVQVSLGTGCSTYWVLYNVTSTTQPTQILSTRSDAQLNYFHHMIYNGTQYSIRTGFTFPSTGLQRVDYVLADGKTRIGSRTFRDVEPVREVHFSNCITSTILGEFGWSGLKTVQMNEGLNLIGVGAFTSTKLTSVTIPDSVKVISADAFTACTSMTSVTIGTGVTQINNSFKGCSHLSRITIMATTPPTLRKADNVDEIQTFDNTNNCPIYVPAASVDAYKAAESWAKYASRVRAIS